jgi:hypothetical protein
VCAKLGTEIEPDHPGGIRAPLLKGPIIHADLAEVDPFDTRVVQP